MRLSGCASACVAPHAGCRDCGRDCGLLWAFHAPFWRWGNLRLSPWRPLLLVALVLLAAARIRVLVVIIHTNCIIGRPGMPMIPGLGLFTQCQTLQRRDLSLLIALLLSRSERLSLEPRLLGLLLKGNAGLHV